MNSPSYIQAKIRTRRREEGGMGLDEVKKRMSPAAGKPLPHRLGERGSGGQVKRANIKNH